MGRACGCPASWRGLCGGRGAMGAPGVSDWPGPGRGGAGRCGGGMGEPGTALGLGDAALEGAGADGPGATTCVGACCNLPAGVCGTAGGVTGRTGTEMPGAGRNGLSCGATAGRADGSAGNGCLGPAGGKAGADGPNLGVAGGSGRAGMEIFRFTGCPVPCASGG
jgi:hypothetical protein